MKYIFKKKYANHEVGSVQTFSTREECITMVWLLANSYIEPFTEVAKPCDGKDCKECTECDKMFKKTIVDVPKSEPIVKTKAKK